MELKLLPVIILYTFALIGRGPAESAQVGSAANERSPASLRSSKRFTCRNRQFG